MKRVKLLSKIFCGIFAASLACTAVASAATGDVAATFTKEMLVNAQGVKTTDSEGYRELVPDNSNTSMHTVYGLEAPGLDGTKAYTIAVKLRLNGYLNGDAGEEGTEPKAKVFGLDPKFNDVDGKIDIEDPADCWFTAQEIWDAVAKYGDGEFITYYLTVTPDSAKYKGVDHLRIENRLTYMAASGEQYMRLAIESLTVYEGEYKVPNGVKAKPAASANENEDDSVSSKPGGSIYNQYANYKGSNKDFVDYNFNNASYDEDYSKNSVAGDEKSYDEYDNNNGGNTVNAGDETVSDIPQSGDSKAIGMIVLAMGGAAVLGGSAIAIGRKKSKSKRK